MWTRTIGILGGLLLLLAACSSAPETPPVAAGGPGVGGPGGIGSRNALPGSQQDLEASAGDRVFFAFDRSDITPEAQEILARQADWLRRYPNAQAVKNVLVASGIPASRISTISYGKERPAVVGSSEEAYAQNRRAVTTVN
jgi:peptidoglycan-associated lipoprotein